MGHYIPLSCTEEFEKRIKEHFAIGQFSKWLVELASKEMDRMDGIAAIKKHQQLWRDTRIKPFIKTYAKGEDPYYLIGNEQLLFELKEAGHEVTKKELQTCIEQIIMEMERDGPE